MLVGLRIISILYDLFLASMLFYRPLSKINMKKKPLVALFFILIFHGELVFLFSESRIFLVSNLLLNILEYKLIASKFFDSSPKGKISWIPWFRTAPANKLRLVCKRIQKEDWRIG